MDTDNKNKEGLNFKSSSVDIRGLFVLFEKKRFSQ